MRINVTCTIVLTTNTVMVWRDGGLVGMVMEKGGEPELQVFGQRDSLRWFSFCDLEIIRDNWNQLQEMRAVETLKKGEKIVDGDDGL